MENKLELSENQKGNWSSVGTPSGPRGGDRIRPTSVMPKMGDCWETAVLQTKRAPRCRGEVYSLQGGGFCRDDTELAAVPEPEGTATRTWAQVVRGAPVNEFSDPAALEQNQVDENHLGKREPYPVEDFGDGEEVESPLPSRHSPRVRGNNSQDDEDSFKQTDDGWMNTGEKKVKWSISKAEHDQEREKKDDRLEKNDQLTKEMLSKKTTAQMGKENQEEMMVAPDEMITRKKMFRIDERDQKLLLPNLTWEEKAVFILNMVRRREIKPTYYDAPTRFCVYNIALFDLDKESVFKRKPSFSKVPDTYKGLATSINIFSIKVVRSDVRYPIDIYGTVLARDMIDYRCVYLFKRGRDNPQRVTAKDGNLTLTGPYRALAAIDVIYLEFNLKIKCKNGVDQDFSKCMTAINYVCATDMHPMTILLESCLSKVQLEFAHVFQALEASIEVNVLTEKEESCFHGKITAGGHKNGIVLYDSKVPGTKTSLGRDGSVSLTRHVVSVPWCGYLGLNFSVPGVKRKFMRFDRWDEEGTFDLGLYELRVKITWMGVFFKHRFKLLQRIGRASVLMEPSFNVIC